MLTIHICRVAALAPFLTAMVVVSTASADQRAVPQDVLQTQLGATATQAAWLSDFGGNPSERPARAFTTRFSFPYDASYNAGLVTAWTTSSMTINRPARKIHNLSYAFTQDGFTGAGTPSDNSFFLSVRFRDGTYADLAPDYCHQPFAPGWDRADFTGATMADGSCGFWDYDRNDHRNRFYQNAPALTAWGAYVKAHPSAVVTGVEFYSSPDYDPLAPSVFAFDDISLGTGKMYTRRNDYVTDCLTEASC